jgi:hypothetical protein
MLAFKDAILASRQEGIAILANGSLKALPLADKKQRLYSSLHHQGHRCRPRMALAARLWLREVMMHRLASSLEAHRLQQRML